MAECTGFDLRKAREARKMTRWELGNAVSVSESTIERWERPGIDGGSKPTPEDVDRLGEALGDTALWHRWMLSNCDSYRKRYLYAPAGGELATAVLRVRHENGDIQRLQDRAELAALGKPGDNDAILHEYAKELRENIAAETAVLQQLRARGVGIDDETA